jgi:ATP-dependent Clp protease ATP-binding subunit ClpA
MGSRSPPTRQARLSSGLSATLQRAAIYAQRLRHEYTTLEHLLLALTEDVNAAGLMAVCDVNLEVLRQNLVSFLENDSKTLVTDDGRQPEATAALRRVIENTAARAHGLGHEAATGGDLLVAVFNEKHSPAVWFLRQQGMAKRDVVNFILHGIVKETDEA